MDTLFSEYLACGGDWLTSTIVVRATSTSSRQIKGREIYIKYCDLVAKHGEATASCIRSEKKRLQLAAGKDEPPFWLKHPEMPAREDCMCIYSVRNPHHIPKHVLVRICYHSYVAGLGDVPLLRECRGPLCRWPCGGHVPGGQHEPGWGWHKCGSATCWQTEIGRSSTVANLEVGLIRDH